MAFPLKKPSGMEAGAGKGFPPKAKKAKKVKPAGPKGDPKLIAALAGLKAGQPGPGVPPAPVSGM